MAITGATDLGDGLLAVTVDHDPLTTATDAPLGSLIINTTSGQWFRKLDSGSSTNVAAIPTGTNVEAVAQPETTVGANGTRVAQTSYEGGSYRLNLPLVVNRLILVLTAVTAPVTLQVLIFQAPNGIGGTTANRIGTFDFSPGAAGQFVLTPTEGTIRIEAGVFYVLMGRTSAGGSGTFRVYTVTNNEGLTATVDTGTHPTNYTTAIATSAGAPPATFNPLQTPGGSASASTVNISPIIRFKKV